MAGSVIKDTKIVSRHARKRGQTVRPPCYTSIIQTNKGQKMNTYPNIELVEMANAYGFAVTPEIIELLNKAYELGVEDTY